MEKDLFHWNSFDLLLKEKNENKTEEKNEQKATQEDTNINNKEKSLVFILSILLY